MKRQILLVEDNEDDAFLMRRALKVAGVNNPLSVAEDGQEAMDYLAGSGKFSDRNSYPFPAFLFLDLKLPFKSGHEVLRWIRTEKKLESLVVLVLTSSSEPGDIRRAYQEGANSYLVKPPSAAELADMLRAFKNFWLDYNRALPQ